MGRSEESKRRIKFLRVHVRRALGLGRGTASGIFEKSVGLICRRALAILSPQEGTDIEFISPMWLTAEFCRSWLSNEPVGPPSAAVPVPSSPTSQLQEGGAVPMRLQSGVAALANLQAVVAEPVVAAPATIPDWKRTSKGRDVFLKQNRVFLKAEAQKIRTQLIAAGRQVPKIDELIKQKGNSIWKTMPPSDRATFIALGSIASQRVRGDSGFYTSAAKTSADDLSVQDLLNVAEIQMSKPTTWSRRPNKNMMASIGEHVVKLFAENKTVKAEDLILNAAVKAGVGHTAVKNKLQIKVGRRRFLQCKAQAASSKVITKTKVGRPRGPAITFDQVKQVMEPYTKPSCRFFADGRQVLTLMGSKRRNFYSSKECRRLCSYRTACRRMQRGKCGIVVGKKYTDSCSICVTYDNQVAVAIQTLYVELEETLVRLLPDYLDPWLLQCSASEHYSMEDFKREDSPSYMQEFMGYLRAHRGEYLYQRMQLTAEGQASLDDAEARGLHELGKWLPILREYNVHFSLRDSLGVKLVLHLADHRTPGVVRILWDYQDEDLFRGCNGSNHHPQSKYILK